MTEFPGAGAAGAAPPGILLAAARKASGLSIAEVAVEMRISPRQVEAIEADRYEDLPGAVFVRGFVRNYARLLNIDPVPLLHALEPALGAEVPLRAQHYAGTLPVPVRRSHARVWLALLGIVLAILVVGGLYEYWRARRVAPQGADSLVVPMQPSAPTAATPAPVERGEPVPLLPERLSDAPKSSKEGAAAPGPTDSAPAPVAPSTASPGVDRLTVEFLQPSWLEVRDRAGRILYSGTGAAASVQSFEAEGPIGVVIGNAPGVRITYNQKPVDVLAYAERNIARFTLE
jgi:cytoskeleton protein RodZ